MTHRQTVNEEHRIDREAQQQAATGHPNSAGVWLAVERVTDPDLRVRLSALAKALEARELQEATHQRHFNEQINKQTYDPARMDEIDKDDKEEAAVRRQNVELARANVVSWSPR